QEGSSPSAGSFKVKNTGSVTLNYSISDNVSWLSVSPSSGSSTGEEDTITVNYSTASLGAGIHNATITVSDSNATNNPQTIAVTLPVNGSGPSLVNGNFANGLTGWSQWAERGTITFQNSSGRGHVSGNNINGGLWQQFTTGGQGTEIDVEGWW